MAAININAARFNELMQGDKPVLVDFWAPWCSYCRRIGPAFEKIAEQYGGEIEVVKINIDEEEALTAKTGIEVIPTLILYRKGKALGTTVAPQSKAAIESFIRNSMEVE
ncbi:MAG: thioredoxin [Clostridia bacterium]|nr:thioredoxin [Clostridia bacterium]